MKQSTTSSVLKLATFACALVMATGAGAQTSYRHHRKHHDKDMNQNRWRQNNTNSNWRNNQGQRWNNGDTSYPDTPAVRYHRSGSDRYRTNDGSGSRNNHWDSNGTWRNRNGANAGNGRWNTNGDWHTHTDNWPRTGTSGRMRHRNTDQDNGR